MRCRTTARLPRFYPVYERALIQDLEATGLFEQADSVDETADADLVATLINRPPTSFSLALSDDPESGIPITVYYDLGRLRLLGAPLGNQRQRDRRQYLDRLSVEVIKAVSQLLERPADAPQ